MAHAKSKRMGKHPYNDMVRGDVVLGKIKNKVKRDAEYAKLSSKDKYPYLRDTYYITTASAEIHFSGNTTLNRTVILSESNGTTTTYTAKNSETLGSNFYKRTFPSSSLANCINGISGSSTITATVTAGTCSLSMTDIGPDGNTTIAGNADNKTFKHFTGG